MYVDQVAVFASIPSHIEDGDGSRGVTIYFPDTHQEVKQNSQMDENLICLLVGGGG